MVDTQLLDVVDVATLHQRLGFAAPLAYPAASLRRSFTEWKMEVDDAPIFRYLYRHFAPSRHLEFGTWAGTGACYCLEESQAAVWTINLPAGEFIDGKPAYVAETVRGSVDGRSGVAGEQAGFSQSDAGASIGQKYREAGFGHRVCQIYCDSREWDLSPYPPGFFDSVLIDGGHSAEVVRSDTRKALAVTRGGALLMWHDFCPDPAVFSTFPSVLGVIQGVTEQWAELAPELKDAFWIRPSFILVGVRA